MIAPVAPSLVRVDLSGPLEQRAGYHDPCGGWSDGHDAIAERLCEAFASGDVLLVVDSPGGAAAGLQQAAARALLHEIDEAEAYRVLLDRYGYTVDTIVAETGQTGFHLVDEAAPPAGLKALAAGGLSNLMSAALAGLFLSLG